MSGVGLLTMNFLRNGGLKKFAAVIFVFRIAAGTSFGEPISTPVTVQIATFANYGAVNPNYNGQTLTNGKAYSMTAKAKSGFTFTGWAFTDAAGSHTNSKAKLTFTNGVSFTAYFADTQKPSVSIQTPPNSTALTNPAVYITGTAKDNDAVAKVYCSLNGGDWQLASTGNGWNNWWTNVTLIPNTNTLRAFAMDRSGNCSKTNLLKMTYSAAPASLNGITMTVTKPDSSVLAFTFRNGTFSEETGVGSFTYKKTGAVAGTLSLKYTAPPSAAYASNNVSVKLQFTDTENGTFTDADGDNSFSLQPADTLAPPALTGSQIFLTDSNDVHQSILIFLKPPNVMDNGNLFKVANPLVISLSAAYPGQINDRVQVTFTHQQILNGAWVTVSPKIFAGTVIAINTTGTNTATILFDQSSFVSKTENYGPTAGLPLNIISFYYTNFLNGSQVTNGSGTFSYTNYTAVGSLLQLNESGTNGFYIMTFTNDSDSGNFYSETYSGFGNTLQAVDSGIFVVALPPLINIAPQNVGVTNGGTASFTVVASGTPPLTYQWQKVGVLNLADGTNAWGSVISGSVTTNLTITGITNNDLGNYFVIINNSYGSVTSAVANLTYAVPPQITSQTPSLNLATGGTALFTVATTGTLPLSFQWQFSKTGTTYTSLTDKINSWGSTISGSLTANLGISNIATNDNGYFQVIVTNNFGSVTSTPAPLTVQ